tara:strand:- start:9338 stop:10645 length:1308 start_codon:yes stop_codon:yes gene_type:complete
MTNKIPRVIVAGIGGFAVRHHEALYQLETEGLLKVCATCDPRLKKLETERRDFAFQERGVREFESFSEMIDTCGQNLGSRDWVSLATPIPCHEEMHRICSEKGIPCYLEKPPTLDPEALERMIARDERGKYSTAVGFNFVSQAGRLALKRRLLDGEFGPICEARFSGAWRRSFGYFSRSSWAGKIFLADRLVLDSCLGNGMSHHVHNLLFLCGTSGLNSWASCKNLRSELYAVSSEEGPDTIFVEGLLREGPRIRLGLTNAYRDGESTLEELYCDRAKIVIDPSRSIQIDWKDGRTEYIPLSRKFPLEYNFREFMEFLDDERDRPPTTLQDCRGLIHLNAMAFIAGRSIHRVDQCDYETIPASAVEKSVRYIPQIWETIRDFVDTGGFPSQVGCAWGRAGGFANDGDVAQIEERARNLKDSASGSFENGGNRNGR